MTLPYNDRTVPQPDITAQKIKSSEPGRGYLVLRPMGFHRPSPQTLQALANTLG